MAETDTKVFAVVRDVERPKVRDVYGWMYEEAKAEEFRSLLLTLAGYGLLTERVDGDLVIVPCNEERLLDAMHSTALGRKLPVWRDPR